MKKVTKKIAALVTMLAFLVTLLPVAAFAEADTSLFSAPASVFKTIDSNEDNANLSLEAAKTDGVNAQFDLVQKDETTVHTAALTNPVYIWAEDKAGNVTDALASVTVLGADKQDALSSQDPTKASATKEASTDIVNTFKLTSVTGNVKVNVTFARAGEYTIRAGYAKAGDEDTIAKLTKFGMDTNKNKIVVKAADTAVNRMVAGTNTVLAEVASNAPTLAAGIKANGIEEGKVEVTLSNYTAAKSPNPEVNKVLKDKVVRVYSNDSNISFDKETYTTDRSGKITVKYTIKKAGTYTVYFEEEDYTGILKLSATVGTATNIKTIKEPSAPIDLKSGAAEFGKDVRFQLTDANGVIIKSSEEPAIANTSSQSYIKVVEQPSGASFKDADFRLVQKDNYYYLALKNSVNKDFKEGKYTVRVALENGKTTEASFEMKKFGTAKEVKVEFDVDTVRLGDGVEATADNANNKAEAVGTVKVVDENGVERNAKVSDAITVGFSGFGVQKVSAMNANGEFTVDTKDDEKYLGSKVTITAVSEKYGLVGTKELVIGEEGASLKFEQTSGSVDKENTVDFQVVDKDGLKVAPGASEVVAYVVKSSNPDATITVDASENSSEATGDLATKGEGKLILRSNKATTAEISVYVKNTSNGRIFANSLTYTFGAGEGTFNDRVVVMSIGSKDTIVNNKIVAIDAAPYIKQNRTFVPIRAVVENFGAKVDWNAEKQEVTIKLGDNTVVMTVGSKEYTLNDKKMTMDVAPSIMNDRTFVPVRFVAEGLGFTVTPTYNTDGTTATVVFAR